LDKNLSTKISKEAGFQFNLKDYTSILGLVILVIISAILSPTFLKPINIMNVLSQIASPCILAIGMTFVILSAGIDLSVGSTMALSGVLVALITPSTGWVIAVILTLIIGIILGLFYGYCITKLYVPPFIVTLAGLTGFRGLALVLTGAAAVPIRAEGFDVLGSGKINSTLTLIITVAVIILLIYRHVVTYKDLEQGEGIKKTAKLIVAIVIIAAFQYIIMQVKGLPIQIAIAIIIFLIFTFILNNTVFGREVYALGGNIEAARLAGIRTNKVLMIIYVISQLLATIGGVLIAARLSSGTPQVGNLGELDAIASAVIGGTSFAGGVGTLGGTAIGVLLIGVLNNLLSLLNVSSDMRMVFKGAIILIAVILDTKFRKRD